MAVIPCKTSNGNSNVWKEEQQQKCSISAQMQNTIFVVLKWVQHQNRKLIEKKYIKYSINLMNSTSETDFCCYTILSQCHIFIIFVILRFNKYWRSQSFLAKYVGTAEKFLQFGTHSLSFLFHFVVTMKKQFNWNDIVKNIIIE